MTESLGYLAVLLQCNSQRQDTTWRHPIESHYYLRRHSDCMKFYGTFLIEQTSLVFGEQGRVPFLSFNLPPLWLRDRTWKGQQNLK